jgi:drug/metabolite transporter (DMT)-like permease
MPLGSVRIRRPAHSHRLMHGLMFVATFCWAANIVAVKEGLTGFSASALTQLRVAGAAVLFASIYFFHHGRPRFRLTRREWGFMALVAMSGVTFNQLFFIGGVARSSVAHAGLIVALGPVMVLVLSCLLRLEALTVPKFVGMLISFAGVAILTFAKGAHGNGSYWKGDLILLAGSAVFAYYTILVKEAADRYDAVTLNGIAYVLGLMLLIPFAGPSLLDVQWKSIPFAGWWGLGFAVVFGSVVPYLIFAVVMTELTAARVAAFAYLQPVIATGLGIWLLQETLTLKIILGGILIIAGVYITERERGEEAAELIPAEGGPQVASAAPAQRPTSMISP